MDGIEFGAYPTAPVSRNVTSGPHCSAIRYCFGSRTVRRVFGRQPCGAKRTLLEFVPEDRL